MKTLSKLTVAASLAALAATSGSAQNFGESCGCPPLASRPTVLLEPSASFNGGRLVPGIVSGGVATHEFDLSVNTLTCDTTWRFNKKIYVPNGKDLVIQPGTVIKWDDNAGTNANALIVSRGGQIIADGTASCPIIMTSSADGLNGAYAVTNRGKWGGLVILGRAFNNVRSTDLKDGGPNPSTSITGTDGVGLIEGLNAGESRNFYGAAVGAEINNDNSGILRHVSLRHGGELLGTANEINGLTMGSVGSGTIIENIEVTSNFDDAFEWFGGSVNCKYLVAMHCDDDYIDYDQGYTGKIQFVYGLQGPDHASGGATQQGDNCIEGDGDDGPGNTAADSDPTIYNVTIIGRAFGTAPLDGEGLELRREAKGFIGNSIFANLNRGVNLATGASANYNTNNTLNFQNNTFQGAATPLRIDGAASAGAFAADLNLSVADASLIDASFSISPLNTNTVTGRVNPIPAFGQATTTLSPPVDGFFTNAKYRGAFEPGAPSWLPRYTVARAIGSDRSVFTCVGDLNGDGLVNSTDFTTFAGRFGSNCN